ncbi:MAG: hypothetical protein RL264_1401 [Bacteroidota bacterium]|jgi:hypothetical protein
MNKLSDLIKFFEPVSDWQEVVRNNFERKSGTYSYVTVTDIEVKYNDQVFYYPTKINFEYGYIKALKEIVRREKISLNEKQIKITERKKIIPFGFYERGKKYSGEIFQIINDIVGTKINSNCLFSPDLLTTRDSPLYNIDSNQKWASYLLVLQRISKNDSTVTPEMLDILNDLLDDYGIHYGYDSSLRDFVLVIFPMPYIKVVENKIKRNESNESIFLVLEVNQLGLFYTSQLKLEIDGLIKNVKKEIIYQKVESVKFGKAKYQVIELTPDSKGEIGFAAFSIKINGILVEKFSGYYIRDIKLDIKVK